MYKLIRAFISTVLLLFTLNVLSQDAMPVSFRFEKERISSKEVVLKIHAQVKPGIKLYTLQQSPADPLFSAITFDSACVKYISGSISEEGKVQTMKDEAVAANVHFVTDSVVWQQKINISDADSAVLKGTIACMYKKGEEFLSGEQAFKFYIQKASQQINKADNSNGITANKSLWWIFITAFAGGLLALLTPCVYSMIPITVSFFTKRSKSRAEGIRNALYYSSSIIIIFTLLGFFITLIFGPAALNNLATNWIANLIFFAIFLIFGVSFLGAFDIQLPSSWSTKADTKAGVSSFAGIFFMALTLVLVSFSCTGPIIGNLLVLAAKGSYYGPLVGMFGFSLALALPFALFAFFPSKLNMLGKAGGWLNSVKVTLGFLELALALKFLSNADLSKGWRLLDREVFISLWITIFISLGLYLFGLIRFKHDDKLPKNDFDLPHLSVTRLLFAIGAFYFAVYMIPGLWGAPLKGISAFVPPMGTQDFNPQPPEGGFNPQPPEGGFDPQPPEGGFKGSLPRPQKYVSIMSMYEPDVVKKYGLVTYFDYEEALEAARKLKKPLMLDFTGINCVNCRKMEGQVWSDAKVMQRLKENFVIVSLYVDVHNIDLPEKEQYFSKTLNKQIETLGDKNADMQVSKFGANTQPYYFFLDNKENRLAPDGYGYDPDVNKFVALLDAVQQAYHARNKQTH